jgi:hypothetical protein
MSSEPDDGGQQVIEIVRDAAGELAHRLHFLALAQRFLRCLELGNVAALRHQPHRLAARAGHGLQREIDDRPHLASTPHFMLGPHRLAGCRAPDAGLDRGLKLRIFAHRRCQPEGLADDVGRLDFAPGERGAVDLDHGAVCFQQRHELQR